MLLVEKILLGSILTLGLMMIGYAWVAG